MIASAIKHYSTALASMNSGLLNSSYTLPNGVKFCSLSSSIVSLDGSQDYGFRDAKEVVDNGF